MDSSRFESGMDKPKTLELPAQMDLFYIQAVMKLHSALDYFFKMKC